MPQFEIRDNAQMHRYELALDGDMAVVTYNLSQTNLMITETLVPARLAGRGLAGRMAEYVIADAKNRGLLILPACPFFASYLRSHPEHADVVHPRYRATLGI